MAGNMKDILLYDLSTGTGSFTQDAFGAYCTVNAVGDTAVALNSYYLPFSASDWSNDIRYKLMLETHNPSGYADAYVGVGRYDSASNKNFAGFKFTNLGYIRTVTSNSTGETVSGDLMSYAGSDQFKLEIIHTAGVDIKYYVDDVLKRTETSTLPSGTLYSETLWFRLDADASLASAVYIRFGEFKYNQIA
jgi:hypothetical protein